MQTYHPILARLNHPSVKPFMPEHATWQVYRCPELQSFTVSGADATVFLQGQLTQDIALQTEQKAQFAGYCTAQGRVLATMVLARNDQPVAEYRCFTHVSVAQALIKRLRMFVMRSKVVFTEPEQAADPIGIVGVSTFDVASLENTLKHTLPRQPWQQEEHATGTWVCAPTAPHTQQAPVILGTQIVPDASSGEIVRHAQAEPLRWWWLAAASHQQSINAIEDLSNLATDGQDDITAWQQFDVQAGLPWVEQPTQDLFIAQTLNLDLIGAVSFTKGCYPGQEVVARAHYRGTLKRRMFLGHIEHAIHVDLASDVFSASQTNEPCGRIINCVTGANRTDLLFESTIVATHEGALFLPTPNLPSSDSPISDNQLNPIKIVIDPLPYLI
jgi:hypothetical protein